MKKIFCSGIFCILFSFKLLAQSGGLATLFTGPEEQGDQLFQNLAYQDALEAYQKAYSKGIKTDQLKLKIAESYRMLNKPAEAEKWYSVIEAKEFTFKPEHLWNYAEALSSLGKYQEAQKWYYLYQEQVEWDGRAIKKLEGIENQIELLKRNAQAVSVQLAPFNSRAADFSPAFYNDGLVFVSGRGPKGQGNKFQWDNSAFLDIYYSKGNNLNSPKEFDKIINSPYHEGPLTFYDNGRKLIFTRNNYSKKKGKSSDGVTRLNLYYSERIGPSFWTDPKPLPFNSNEFSTGHPTISSDGKTLYFASDRPGGIGGADLYKVEFVDGKWQEPENLGDMVNTEGDELFPFLYQDQQLYFASNGHGGLGGLDVYGIDISIGRKGRVRNVGAPVNSSSDDFGLILDQAGTSGYFSSNREGGMGNDDVYSFSTSRSMIGGYRALGRILSASNGAPQVGVEVLLLDGLGNILQQAQSGGEGGYEFELEPDKSYQLFIEKPNFTGETRKFKTSASEGPDWVFDLYLTENKNFSLFGIIKDLKTNEALQGVQFILIDNSTGKVMKEARTGASGEFLLDLLDKKPKEKVNFKIQLAKAGYIGKSLTFQTTFQDPTQIKLHELMDLSLDKLQLGMDLGMSAGVMAVPFSRGSFKIRSDAAAELDKIVMIMKENPKIEIELGSYTDSRGTTWDNLMISEKRAKASVGYLVAKGIKRSRVMGRGFGESDIRNGCTDDVPCSEKEHQQNVRTEFIVVKF